MEDLDIIKPSSESKESETADNSSPPNEAFDSPKQYTNNQGSILRKEKSFMEKSDEKKPSPTFIDEEGGSLVVQVFSSLCLFVVYAFFPWLLIPFFVLLLNRKSQQKHYITLHIE